MSLFGMTPRHSTTALFQSDIMSTEVVIVDFWALWCKPCKQFDAVIDAICDEVVHKYPRRVSFLKIDVDKEGGLAERFNVLSLPTVIGFRNGRMVEHFIGSKNAGVFKRWVEKLIEGCD